MTPLHTHDILSDLISRVRCKPGWRFAFYIEENGAKRLIITVAGIDARYSDSQQPIAVRHFFPIPDATYNEKTWRRWLFERCRGVENHELGEWFVIDGERPFAPLHGPGEDPYIVHEFRPEIDARIVQDGSILEP